ncbi:DUF87 domain-containing protein [candidate division WWE3 bacterium]|uniref:DUF87 domain-containing protein n=1 Tax=candidate division WWE3 bacterium TaxID=2053526 RepID=A0A955LKT6_UNCKA|nr:DUF87 domain-containing protein [candidate division WWE3 bacterium]
MPQFDNLPNKLLSVEESKKRLQQLTNQPTSETSVTNQNNKLNPKSPDEQKASLAESNSDGQEVAKVPKVEDKSTNSITSNPGSTLYWHELWTSLIDKNTINDPQMEKVIMEVSLPQDNEIEALAAEQMYASMIGLGKHPGKVFETLVGLFPKLEILFKNHDDAMSFEIAASEKMIHFWVVCPKQWQEFIERQIHGAYPEAEVFPVKVSGFIPQQGVVKFAEMQVKGKPYYPIRLLEDFETDTISSITSTVSKLDAGERVIIQHLLQPADDSWRKRGQQFVQLAQAPPKGENDHKANIDPKVLEAVSTKVTKPGYRTVIRIYVQSPDAFRAETILNNITGAYDQFSQPHLAAFKANKKKKINAQLVSEFITRSFPRWGNYPILNTLELATIFHFPNQEIKTPRINWLRIRKSAPPTNLPEEGLYLGISEYRNAQVKVRLQRDDRRRHMYIIGQTGSGKTQFLQYMAYQDILNGEGLAFIDPHGDAVEFLLESIPKERAEDVIYFCPSDSERPMGLNILDVKGEEAKHMTVNSFIELLYKLYDPNRTGMVGPQLERAVRNVMLTAMSEPGNTMVEVLRLLTNPKYAEKKIPLIQDPLVKTYWTEQISQTNEFHRSETLGYFVSKFDRFVTEKLMRNIIGQSKSAFDFRDVMDNQKILLVNLSKGKIGEANSSFLGLLLVPRILAAAMSRADMPQEERKDFYLYVDEFQNFSTPDFAEILAEARKYRLNLSVANQYISQINEDIKNAVFGNVGTMCAFRVGADDGEYMEKQFEPVFKQSDLINQSVGEAITRLLIGGQPSRPFSFRTDWPAMQAIPKNEKVASVIKEISRLKYGRDRAIVEREIATRAGFE